MDGKRYRNVLVRAGAVEGSGGFDVLLDFSGTLEKVYHHHHDGLLYEVLKDGIRLESLMRWRPAGMNWVPDRSARRQRRTRQEASVARALASIAAYLREREDLQRPCI